MFEKGPQNFNCWYDLYVNGNLLVSIKGEETAKWFLKSMSHDNLVDTFTLEPKEDKEISIEDIKAATPW